MYDEGNEKWYQKMIELFAVSTIIILFVKLLEFLFIN